MSVFALNPNSTEPFLFFEIFLGVFHNLIFCFEFDLIIWKINGFMFDFF
jgi:hypothetical protein